MKKQIYLLLLFLIAIALRLYPYATSGVPFSTDAWSPIRNTELLIEHTPVPLGDNKIFDGYNNYWPANSLFGAVFSQVTGVEPKQAMATILPIIGSMAILIFYVLIRRLYNEKISFIASIIFGTAFTHVYFTAAVTKETYANPLYLSLLLIFLHPTIAKRKQILLFTIAAIALAFTHHLTPLITIAILSSIAIARFINNTKKGIAPNKSDFTLVSILTVATAFYFGLYAQAGFKFTLTLSDMLSAASYQLLTFALATYLVFKPNVKISIRIIIMISGAMAIALLFTLLATMISLVAGLPTVPRHYLIYNFPYVIVIPLIILGYGYRTRSKSSIASIFWVAPIIGLEAYAIFSNSILSLPLTLRTFNFLHPPIAVLSAAGLYGVYETVKKPKLKSLIKLGAIVTILIIVSINSYSMYATINLEERYLGYHWLYKTEEFKAGTWITAVTNTPTIAGDIKIAYLMQDYFQVNADILQGYRYLAGEDESQPQILFIYDQMLKNGYVIGFHGVDLPSNWMEKTAQLNLIYSNSLVNLYTGEDV